MNGHNATKARKQDRSELSATSEQVGNRRLRPTLPSQRDVAARMMEVVPLVEDPRRPGCVAGVAICTRPVAGILTAGCLHEHIRRGRVCAVHLNDQLQCRACHDNPTQPHRNCTVQRLHVEGDYVG